MSPRAIKARESRAALKGLNVAAPEPETGYSQEPIGVADNSKGPEREPEKNDFTCGNCQTIVFYGDPKCSVCEIGLEWDGIAE